MFATTLIAAVSAASAFAYLKGENSEVEYVRSNVDGRQYLVQKIKQEGAGSSEAADALGKINSDLEALIRHMQQKFPDDERVRLMAKRFNPTAVSEGNAHSGYTSYSISKGERIVLCLRQTDDSFADPNVVLYVALHELAHLGTISIGHKPEFWKLFSDILKEAVSIGIYKKVDYSKQPAPFCGITVDSSVI
jgi:WLM domain